MRVRPLNGRLSGVVKNSELLFLFLTGEVPAKARTFSPREKKQVLFCMATGNGELTHECFPNDSRMGTARIK